MKGFIILANGFEDVEAIATIDVLRRSNILLDLVSIYDTLKIKTARNIYVEAEKRLSEIIYEDYDFVIIPGGGAVFNQLMNFDSLKNIIKYFFDANKLIAAICAAPILLDDYLGNYQYTCFKDCEKDIKNGIYINEPIVIDRNLITAKSMYYSNDFGLEIIRYLKGNDEKDFIEKQIKSI